MVPLRSLLTLAYGLLFLAALPPPATAGELEDGVLAELNFARTQPQAYADEMLREPATYDQQARHADLRDQDPEAFEEAVDFLMRQPALPPLRPDVRIAAAAHDHAAWQGERGGLGHTGPGGQTPGARLQHHGVWAGLSAENISYGYSTPREVILQLIIDSGVPSRGHRQNIFGANYQIAGVGCGRHRTYDAMCVIDFAGAVVAR